MAFLDWGAGLGGARPGSSQPRWAKQRSGNGRWLRGPGRKAGDPAWPLPRARRPRAGSSPAPAARRPPGISRRARFRRWQRWFSPERPDMAGAPGPLRLALLLLGAVGRAGPRPQVRPWSPGKAGRRERSGRRVLAGAAGLERNSATAGRRNRSFEGSRDRGVGFLGWVAEVAWPAGDSPIPGAAPCSCPPRPLCQGASCPAAAGR